MDVVNGTIARQTLDRLLRVANRFLDGCKATNREDDCTRRVEVFAEKLRKQGGASCHARALDYPESMPNLAASANETSLSRRGAEHPRIRRNAELAKATLISALVNAHELLHLTDIAAL